MVTLITGIEWVGGVASGVCANYFYDRIVRNNPLGVGLGAYLPLNHHTLEKVDLFLRDFAADRQKYYFEQKERSAERYFRSIVEDQKPDFLFPLIDQIFFDPDKARTSLTRHIRSFIEPNENVDAERIAVEIIDQLKERMSQKLPVVGRVVDSIRFAERTFEMVSSLNVREDSTSGTDVEGLKDYTEYVEEKFQSIMLHGFDGYLKNEHVLNDLDKSFVSLHLDSGQRGEKRSIPCEEVAARAPYLVLRGNPGCGKTTVLQWLCLKACKKQLGRNVVPFLIPLRSVVSKHDSSFSLKSAFACACTDEDVQLRLGPDWMESCLESRESLVMLDGLDEVPFENRSYFWKFVGRLRDRYPLARIIVTSRNLYHTHDGQGFFKEVLDMSPEQFRLSKFEWAPPDGFLDFRIQGLQEDDVDHFIDKWHAGIDRTQVHPDVANDLDHLAFRVKVALNTDEDFLDIRELARTPMFCALLCLVNLDSRGKLPDSPKELYRQAINILVQSRDELRGVPIAEKYRQFDPRTRKDILGFIGYLMQKSKELDGLQQLEVKTSDVQDWVKLYREKYARDTFLDISDAEIVEFFVERISVIRQPTAGYVDFAHRSFMEYLAAEHFVDFQPASLIPSLCNSDFWHGMVRFQVDSENGSDTHNMALLEQIYQFTRSASEVSDVSEFVESVISILNRVPIDAYETYENLISILRPITKYRARSYRNVPIRILENALDRNIAREEKVILEKGNLFLHHTSRRSEEILREQFVIVKADDFISSLNLSRKVPIKKHSALLGKLRSGSAWNSRSKVFDLLYCDDLRVLRDTLFSFDAPDIPEVILKCVIVSGKTVGLFDANVFGRIGSVYIDSSDRKFVEKVSQSIRKESHSVEVLLNKYMFDSIGRELSRVRHMSYSELLG